MAVSLARVMGRHHQARDQRAIASADYASRILHGKPGDTVFTTWGYYLVGHGFHQAWQHGQGTEPGPWLCSTCWDVAEPPHHPTRCRTCASRLLGPQRAIASSICCPNCGISMTL